RMLNTLETGEVASKPASLEWAKRTLDPQWRDLIQQVIDDRPLGFDLAEPPREGTVEPTLAFAEYAKERARKARVSEGAGTKAVMRIETRMPGSSTPSLAT